MKLNLGCGSKILENYTNLDKFDYYNPNVVHDLEVTPYPFEDNSVDEILMSHVLEHIGQDPDIFNNIIKELYRICKNKSIIEIIVPHPRHDDFLSDPTHVRPITIDLLKLYDKELNKKWENEGHYNTPLGLIHGVNFKILKADLKLDEKYKKLIVEKKISQADIFEITKKYNNVVKEMKILWSVVKD
jgi:ubiquinone/menaquinone biosynthesis C-methylase UbiE